MTKQKRTHKTAKVLLSLAVAGALVGSVFAGCSAGKSDKGNKNATAGVTGSITVVSREEGSGTRAVFDAAVQQVDGQVKLALALNRQEAIKQSVKAGLGVGCLSALSIADQVASGELVVLESALQLRRRFSLVTQPVAVNTALTQAFISHLENG